MKHLRRYLIFIQFLYNRKTRQLRKRLSRYDKKKDKL